MPQLDANGLQLCDLDPHAVEDVVEDAGARAFDGSDAIRILHSFAFFSQPNSSGGLQRSFKQLCTGIPNATAIDEIYKYKHESSVFPS